MRKSLKQRPQALARTPLALGLLGPAWNAYAPRRPEQTALYRIVREDLESFLVHAREHRDGGLPKYVEQEFRA